MEHYYWGTSSGFTATAKTHLTCQLKERLQMCATAYSFNSLLHHHITPYTHRHTQTLMCSFISWSFYKSVCFFSTHLSLCLAIHHSHRFALWREGIKGIYKPCFWIVFWIFVCLKVLRNRATFVTVHLMPLNQVFAKCTKYFCTFYSRHGNHESIEFILIVFSACTCDAQEYFHFVSA